MIKRKGSKLEARIFIWEFFKQEKDIILSQAIKKLKSMGYKETTIRRIYKRFIVNIEINMERKPNKKQLLRKDKISKCLLKEIENKPFKSFRFLGKKVGCSPNTVQKYCKDMEIIPKAKKIIPKVTPNQKRVQNLRIKKFVNKFLRKETELTLMMDDESYFTLDGTKWSEKNYYAKNGLNVSKNGDFLEKSKFTQKVMMWIAISEKGISEAHFFKGVSSINSAIYSKDCLPKVEKFIKKCHKKDKILFWPDLASCHYSKLSQNTMDFLKIEYLKKDYNPPNCPQIRPIEKFWSYLKRHVYKNGRVFKNSDQLISRIKYLLNTLDLFGFRLSMKNLPKKVRKAQKIGLRNIF